MLDIARDALSFTAALPLWLAAILIGWAISAGVTQALKFAMPLRWPEELRHEIAYAVALFSAGIPAGLWMIDGGAGYVAMSLTAVAAGLWSPIAFSLLQRGLRASPRTVWIADVLSGDVRRGSP